MAKNQEVQTTQSQALATIDADLLAQLQGDAKDAAALERPSVSNLSFRAGILSFNGEACKDNVLDVVVIGAAFVNTYYGSKFDPDNVVNPDCFALSPDGEKMVPHPAVPNPIHSSCSGCKYNEWGSDEKDGKPAKGKRCKESRRLVLLPWSALTSAEDIVKAELAQCKLPVTSVKAWGSFVNTLAATINMPYYAVKARITTKPDLKTQFKVVITPMEQISDASLLRAILKKREEAMRVAMLPFDVNAGEDDGGVAPAANEPANAKF